MADIGFEGQVAIVTGAGRGLGRLYALELARRGAKVVVNDLGGSSTGQGASADQTVADQVVAEIEAAGGAAVASTDTVATPAGGKAIVEAAMDHFGRVDAVVNNAGIVQFAPFEDIAAEEFGRMLDVHLKGIFNVSQPAYRAMKAQGYGRFVFVSSSAGMLGCEGNLHYGTAKAGVVGFSNVLALEGAAHGIKSNALLPTGHSRMVTDQQKPGTAPTAGQAAFYAAMRPELITPMVVYLASRDCAVSHQNFASCMGRYSRVFVGYADGWLADADDTPAVEDIAARIDEIAATDSFFVPASLVDEVFTVCAQRGIDLAAA